MTADKGGGKRADMTMEWKRCGSGKCTVDPLTIVQRLGEDCPISWFGVKAGWYRGGGQVGYLVI